LSGIIGGLYCGVSGYACAAQKEEVPKPDRAKVFDADEQRRKELAEFLFGDLAKTAKSQY